MRDGVHKAKLWLRPEVRIAYNDGLSLRDLRELMVITEQKRAAFERSWNEHSAKSIRFDEDSFWLELDGGRALGVPLAWFPRLLHATPEQLHNCEISKRGVHWEALDEDISIAGVLQGLSAFESAGTAA